MPDAKHGLRGTGDFPGNQRPTNFGGRVSKKDTEATINLLRANASPAKKVAKTKLKAKDSGSTSLRHPQKVMAVKVRGERVHARRVRSHR